MQIHKHTLGKFAIDQGPELQCLLRDKEDLGIKFSGFEKYRFKLIKIKIVSFDHKYCIDPGNLFSI